MYLKRPATQKITIRDFRRISSDLTMRGFVEEPRKAEQGVMHDRMLVASFTRAFSDFVITVGASQEAADVLEASTKGLGRDEMGACLFARCVTGASREVGEFAHMFPYKSHYVSNAAPDAGQYHADLVPFPDPSILIDSCLRLGSAVAKVKNDPEFAAAIDAKEVQDSLGLARSKVRRANSYAAYLDDYLGPLLGSLRTKIDYEFARIAQDPLVVQALVQVADRE